MFGNYHQVLLKFLTIFLFTPSGFNLVWSESIGIGHTNDLVPNGDSWHYWWSYSSISGPSYWGLLNLDWAICDQGRRQSPIDIQTNSLMYDPHLGPLHADNNLISGLLYNDGHAVVFNGSMSPYLMANSKSAASVPGKKINLNQSDGSIAKREAPQEGDGIFGSTNSLILEQVDKLNSASVLGDLSSSVELSIEQNSKIELDADNKLASNGNSGDTSDEQDANDLIASTNSKDQKLDDDPSLSVQFTGAGLDYPYKFEALYLRFGSDSKSGSEHRINSRAYAAELQLLSYNSLLYKSYQEASTRPHGLLAIAILVDVAPSPKDSTNDTATTVASANKSHLNEQLEALMERLSEVKYRGSSAVVRNFNLSALLPETRAFVAYEGSQTTPGCQESVNWLVLNKPLYITQTSLTNLRSISTDEQSNAPTGTFIADNIRPVQPVNGRSLRTNIKPSSPNEESCQRMWTRYEYRQTRAMSY